MSSNVIAIVGGKKSGKTTTIELLTKELAERGYKIAAVKHIPEPNFTIDKEGKDTWRYVQAGATKVVCVSADEIATIEKTRHSDLSLKKILQKCRGSDLVFLEGFRKLVAKDDKIYKILVVHSAEEAIEDMKTFHPIIALTGPLEPKLGKQHIPYVDVCKSAGKLADLVERVVIKEAAT
jgi:molybdopterin-guanine dinucleotide biosynthesis protein MobB